MYRLPLFPLNSVLFPKMPLSLHIFEERYKLMIRRCIDQRQPFGVVLLESGSEVEGFGSQAVPHSIGCTASITQVQELELGHMNIVATGDQRFRIHTMEYNEPYFVGLVDNLPSFVSDPDSMRRSGNRLRVWMERYLNVLESTKHVRFDRTQLPDNDIDMAYLAASLLKVSMSEKQALLAENDVVNLLDRLRVFYRKEVTILDFMVAEREIDGQTPFSIN